MLKTYFKMATSPSSCWEMGVGEVSLIFHYEHLVGLLRSFLGLASWTR